MPKVNKNINIAMILFSIIVADQLWVFGLVDTLQTPSLGYTEIVPQKDAATLLRFMLLLEQSSIWMNEQHITEFRGYLMYPHMALLTIPSILLSPPWCPYTEC